MTALSPSPCCLLLMAASLASGFSLASAPHRLGLPAAGTRRSSPVTLDVSNQQQQQIITFSERATAQIHSLREKQGVDTIHLRMGVRAGGCSGMSYVLDFMEAKDVDEKDTIIEYDHGIRCCIDPKSLMFLYGLKLDYSEVRPASPPSLCALHATLSLMIPPPRHRRSSSVAGLVL
jgi:iron-sulfur cluster assembly protein